VARLKATDARNLPKSIKVALRIRDKVAQNQEELLKWVKNLNPGLNTEHWRVLDKKSEPKSKRLNLLIDRDAYQYKEDRTQDLCRTLTGNC
jgi:hypothetical protein